MKNLLVCMVVGAALLVVPGCGADAPSEDGPKLAIDVAALSLDGVGDAIWDIEVVNGRTPTPDVVWQRRISSTGYGDSAGSASYVGTCDADSAVSTNTVRVWVVGVYSSQITALGSFDSGALNGATGPALDFQNPTTDGPLTQDVVCRDNADVAVQFDVALMRPAQQGFFDIAVNFNNIFCSAKFDCCAETQDGTACASDIELLYAPGGGRASTMVLGFACTAGTGSDVTTNLYLDALALDCSSPSDFETDFDADFLISPDGPGGNKCSAGDVGGGACAAVTSPGALDADAYLYQVAVYQGQEQLTSGTDPAQKSYWNVALGVVRADGGAGIEDCWLQTRGTADDTSGSSVMDLGSVAAGAVYPYVQWQVDLGSCKAEPLTFGDDTAMVRAEYTTTSGTGTTFAYGFGPGTPDTFGDGLDQNGDGADGVDADRDGNASIASGGTDCDDTNASVTYGTATCPAETCDDLLSSFPGAGTGLWVIQPPSAATTYDVYCDMTTDGGGWTLVFKKSSGVTNDPDTLWNGANTNGGNTALADRDLETLDYANPVYAAAWADFSEARIEAVTAGAPVAWIDFDTTSTTTTSWFAAAQITSSSWTDLAAGPFNYFSIAGDAANGRRFFVNKNYGGCGADVGWLSVNSGASAPCAWNTTYTVTYSAGTVSQNWETGNTPNADALTVWLR